MKHLIDNWAKERKDDFIKYYEDKGIKASGNWSNELDYQILIEDFNIKVRFLGTKYTEQLVYGRGPNKNKSNLKAWVGWAGSTFLKDWVEQKGISANPYAVAWKIGRQGYKAPAENLINDVLTQDRINELAKIIGNSIVNDVKLTILGNGNN